MFLCNEWKGGNIHLEVPPLPPERKFTSGAMLDKLTVDPSVGEETALFLLDDPDFAKQLGTQRQFNLDAASGMVRTSAGLIAYVIWSVSNELGHLVDYEHPLNPFDIGTVQLLSGTAQQSHLKVIILDSFNSKVEGFYQFENIFGLEDLASGIATTIGNEQPADFTATQAAMQSEFTLAELKGE